MLHNRGEGKWAHLQSGIYGFPKLGEVIRKYSGQLKVAPCNVDENPELASQFGVRVIPALLLFKNGEVVDQAMGTFNDINEAEVDAKCQSLIGT